MPHDFTVEGTGSFPIDMLRYDACWPVSEGRDSAAIERSFRRGERGPHRVTLRTNMPSPTVGRWESFGYKVVNE